MFTKASEVMLLALVLVCGNVRADETTRYVQAVKVDLYSEPNQTSAKVSTLKRGESVTLVETKDLFVKVKAGKATGWTSKIFLSATKPVGQADLQKEVPTSLEKASRRRPPSYTVNAAARGLAEDENTQDGSATYKADFKALKKVEERKVPPAEVEKFRDSAKLPK